MREFFLRYFKLFFGFVLLLSNLYFGLVRADDTVTGSKQFVVMITGYYPTTGKTTLGAGIVVGQQGGSVYIVTAGHVLKEAIEFAEDVTVQFLGKPGFKIEATLLPNNFDENVDLAIIAVPVDSAPKQIVGLADYAIANLASAPKKGDGTFFIGQPGGRPWGANSIAAPILEVQTTRLEVATDAVVQGFSGGATLDEQGRIIGLTYAVGNRRALIIPIVYIKENVERSGYPFQIVNAGINKEIIAPKSQPKAETYLKSKGYRLDIDSYFKSVLAADEAAMSIFHNMNMNLKSEQTLQWIKENRYRFNLKEIRNFAHYAQVYQVKSNQGLLRKLLDEFSVVDDYLKSARAGSIDVAELCRIYQKSEPIFGYSDQNGYCTSLPKQNLVLEYLYNVFNSYIPPQQLNKSDYILENYIPTWFVNGETPKSVNVIEFKNKRDENKIPSSGYSIAEADFTVWDGSYAILPDFGSAIRLNNSKSSLQNRRNDGDICYSFSFSGMNVQHVPCYGSILLYRRTDSLPATVIAVRDHLNSAAENEKFLRDLQFYNVLSDQTWGANETQASIFAHGESRTQILKVRCVGSTAYVTTDIGDIVGKLPNKFDMKFTFFDGEYVLQFTGQVPRVGKTYRPYVGLAPRELLLRLAGTYTHVDLSIEGIDIGHLPLRDAKWALDGALQGKGCY